MTKNKKDKWRTLSAFKEGLNRDPTNRVADQLCGPSSVFIHNESNEEVRRRIPRQAIQWDWSC